MNKLNLNYKHIFFLPKKHKDMVSYVLKPELFERSIFTDNSIDLIKKSQEFRSTLNSLVYYLDNSSNHNYVLKIIKKISLHINIIILTDAESKSCLKDIISFGIFKIIEAPFYKSELNLLIEKSINNFKLDHKFRHILHVCDDVNDFIYFKTLQLNHIQNKSVAHFEFKNISEESLVLPPLPFSSLLKHFHTKNEYSEKTHNILIVEDNQELNQKMAIWFNQHNYNVSSAFSYQDAITILSGNNPHFVFIDIALDGHSGEDLIHYITSYYPNIIPIVITAFNDNELMLKCINSGAYDFITKPFNPNEILEKLQYYIQKKSLKNAPLKQIQKIATTVF